MKESTRIGKKIIDARRMLRISQRELARAANISQAAMSRIESGKRVPRLATLRKIAHELGLSPGELLDE